MDENIVQQKISLISIKMFIAQDNIQRALIIKHHPSFDVFFLRVLKRTAKFHGIFVYCSKEEEKYIIKLLLFIQGKMGLGGKGGSGGNAQYGDSRFYMMVIADDEYILCKSALKMCILIIVYGNKVINIF